MRKVSRKIGKVLTGCDQPGELLLERSGIDAGARRMLLEIFNRGSIVESWRSLCKYVGKSTRKRGLMHSLRLIARW